jgi:hypothetical protein
MKRLLFVVLVLCLTGFMSIFIEASPINALSSVEIVAFRKWGGGSLCDGVLTPSINADVLMTPDPVTQLVLTMWLDVNGSLTKGASSSLPRSSDPITYFDMAANSGTPVPANTPVTLYAVLHPRNGSSDPNGPDIVARDSITVNCTTLEIIPDVVPDAPSIPNAPRSPSLPAGFVLRTITCNTPVFDSPGGVQVGANALRAGQTWYVNPTPVDGTDNQLWTEVFVSGFNNVYVPSACVQ